MPPYGFPYLAQYYYATLIVTAVSLVATTLILNIYHRSTRRVPWIVKKVIIDWLGRLVFCSCRPYNYATGKHDLKIEKIDDSAMLLLVDRRLMDKKNEIEREKAQQEELKWKSTHENGAPEEKTNLKNGYMNTVEFNPAGVGGEAIPQESITQEKIDTDAAEVRRKEWLKVARTLDRFFFAAFSITLLATAFAVFLRAPRFGLFEKTENV